MDISEKTMLTRMATVQDLEEIQSIHMHAFSKEENKLVSKIAINLLSRKTKPQTISIVSETDNSIVGHIAFSPVTSDKDDKFLGYILAPLGVEPSFQKRGIGSKLVETGIHLLSTMKVDTLFVYGDPDYYRRFGFSSEEAVSYTPPYKLQYPSGWQSLVLREHDIPHPPIPITCVDSLCDPELW